MTPLAEILSPTELVTVKQCLHAAIEGSFFPEWEFQTLIGVDRQTVRKVYESWPTQTISTEEFGSAIVGSMNNLLGYPHGKDEELRSYLSDEIDEVRAPLDHLLAIEL